MPHLFPAPGTRRLFVCLLPEAPVRQAIGQLRTGWHWPADRWWTEPARLHVTVADPLYFTAAELISLQVALSSLRFAPFVLRLRRARVSGSHLGLQAEPCLSFKALQTQVAQLARQAGAPFQHWPTPHVTLSRHAGGLASPPLDQPIDWPVAEVLLVWSQLKADVGRRHYKVLARYEADSALQQSEAQQLVFGF